MSNATQETGGGTPPPANQEQVRDAVTALAAAVGRLQDAVSRLEQKRGVAA